MGCAKDSKLITYNMIVNVGSFMYLEGNNYDVGFFFDLLVFFVT